MALAEPIEGKDFFFFCTLQNLWVLPAGIGIDWSVWCFNEPTVSMIGSTFVYSWQTDLCVALAFPVDGLSVDLEAHLRISRHVKNLQGRQGCEETGYRQRDPGDREVRTGSPRTPARPHPGTGKMTYNSVSCSICWLCVIGTIKWIAGAEPRFINWPSAHGSH